MTRVDVRGLYDEATATITYVAFDPSTRDARCSTTTPLVLESRPNAWID